MLSADYTPGLFNLIFSFYLHCNDISAFGSLSLPYFLVSFPGSLWKLDFLAWSLDVTRKWPESVFASLKDITLMKFQLYLLLERALSDFQFVHPVSSVCDYAYPCGGITSCQWTFFDAANWL